MKPRTLALILLISLMVFQLSTAMNLAISVPKATCTFPETDHITSVSSEIGFQPSGDQMDTPSMPS